MAKKLTEAAVEEAAIAEFKALGYAHRFGPEVPAESSSPRGLRDCEYLPIPAAGAVGRRRQCERRGAGPGAGHLRRLNGCG